MKSLYLFKSTPYNITNLPQFCVMLTRRDLYDPCTPIIVNGNLDVNVAEFIKRVSPDNPKLNFRNTNWVNHVEILDDIINADNKLVLGINDPYQIEFLISRYGDQAMSITCGYSEHSYDIMLTWYAKRHILFQESGRLPLNETDHEIRNSNVDLVSYYKKSFDQQQLIPKVIPEDGDYNIPIKDLFNSDVFFQHLSNLEASPTAYTEQYYSEWYSYNRI